MSLCHTIDNTSDITSQIISLKRNGEMHRHLSLFDLVWIFVRSKILSGIFVPSIENTWWQGVHTTQRVYQHKKKAVLLGKKLMTCVSWAQVVDNRVLAIPTIATGVKVSSSACDSAKKLAPHFKEKLVNATVKITPLPIYLLIPNHLNPSWFSPQYFYFTVM